MVRISVDCTMAPCRNKVENAIREFIVKLHFENKSLREIGKIVGKSHPTVQSIINKYKTHRTVNNLPGTGREKILLIQTERYIVREIKQFPKTSIPKLTHDITGSSQMLQTS